MKPEKSLWALVQDLERAAWRRKWSELRKARKALEYDLGPRPKGDPFWDLLQEEEHPHER